MDSISSIMTIVIVITINSSIIVKLLIQDGVLGFMLFSRRIFRCVVPAKELRCRRDFSPRCRESHELY